MALWYLPYANFLSGPGSIRVKVNPGCKRRRFGQHPSDPYKGSVGLCRSFLLWYDKSPHAWPPGTVHLRVLPPSGPAGWALGTAQQDLCSGFRGLQLCRRPLSSQALGPRPCWQKPAPGCPAETFAFLLAVGGGRSQILRAPRALPCGPLWWQLTSSQPTMECLPAVCEEGILECCNRKVGSPTPLLCNLRE